MHPPTGGARAGAALRAHRRDVALEVTRSGSALVGAVSLSAVSGTGAAVAAHLALLAVSLVVLLRLVRGARCSPPAALALTGTTIAFFAVHTALWHDVPGAGTGLGVLALVEAAVRFGLRGALVSGALVTGTALLLPQVAAGGGTQSPGRTLLLVAVLLAAAVWLRHGSEHAAAQAEQAEAAVADALASLPVGVAVLTPDGHLLHRNARFAELLGQDVPDLSVLPLPGTERVELERGDRVLALGSAATAGGRVVVHVEDVTAARLEREHLGRLAGTDRLTALTSRTAGEDLLRRRAQEGGRYAVLFVDLDGVKRLNDVRGHAAGDVALAEAARRLRSVLDARDTAVRWGGDEFVVVLEGADGTTGLVVAERVRRALREPVLLEGGREVLTASVGLAPSDGVAGDLVRAADAAMYAAKRAGGDRVVLAESPAVQLPEPRPAALPVRSA